MKQSLQKIMSMRLLLLLAMLVGVGSGAWADSETIDFSAQGYSNAQTVSETLGTNVKVSFTNGSTATAYYTTGTGVRIYGGGSATFTATGANVTNVELTFSGTYAPSSADVWVTAGTSTTTTTWSGSAEAVTISRPSGSGHWRLQKAVITYSSSSNPAVATTTTINVPTGFNTDVYTSTTAGTLTATVATSSGAISGASVTWSSTNENVATVDANGAVTLVAAGTTTIKATYAGVEDQYQPSTGSYELTVTNSDPNAPGTENDPYTVAEARAAIDAGTGVTGVYATGIVSAIPTAWSTQYNNITFNFVDESGDTEFLQAFRCVSTDDADASTVAVGDIVVVYGNLTKYNTTYEFGQGCKLISLTHPTAAVETPIFSPDAGTCQEAQMVAISCTTSGATIYYTTDGSEPTNASTQYSGPFAVSTTTTIKAIAIKGSDQSAVATATYHFCSADSPYTVTQALAFYDYPANGIYVSGIVSTAPTQAPTSNGELTYYISVDGSTTNQLQVYKGKGLNEAVFTAQEDIQVGDEVTIFGNVKIYNSTKEFDTGNYLVAFNRPTTPVVPTFNIIGYSDPVEFPASFPSVGGVGCTYGFTVDNFTGTIDDIQYVCYNANNETISTPSWLGLRITSGSSNNFFEISMREENTSSEARTVYVKLYATVDGQNYYSEPISITQEGFVSDYATLPFEFDGGKTDIATTNGLTHEGLGTDYNSSPKLKFDGTGDNLILHFDERPGTLTFDIKGNPGSGSWAGTFTVQTSVDGETYTDLENYTALTSTTQSEEFTDLGENVRYIKWIYTEKSAGNVALGNIQLAAYTEPPLVAAPVIEGDESFVERTTVVITCATEGAEILYSDDNGETWYEYDGDFDVTETKTILAKATKDGETSTITSKTFTLVTPLTVAEARAAIDAGTGTQGVYVAGIVSKVVKVEGDDFDGYIFTYDISDDGTTTADQLQVYKGRDEGGELFDDNNSIQDGDEVVVYGNLTKYNNSVYEFAEGNVLVSLVRNALPTNQPDVRIEDNTDIEVSAAATSGIIHVNYINITDIDAEVYFCTEDDDEDEREPATYDWITAIINSDNNVEYTISANTGEARTAYMRVKATDDDDNDIYSYLISITQAAVEPTGNQFVKVTQTSDLEDGTYLIVYENGELAFNGGLETLDASKNSIEVEIADGVIARTTENIAAVFTISAVEGGYTIKAANGKYIGNGSDTNGLTASDDALVNTISFGDDGEANIIGAGGAYLRYNATSGQERFRYYKSGTYTGQKPIALYKLADTSHQLTWSADAGASISVVDNEQSDSYHYVFYEGSSAMVAEGTEVTVIFAIEEGYVFDKVVVMSGQDVITPLDWGDDAFTFTMPGNETNIHVYTFPALSGTWVKTDLDEITEDDIFVIVSNDDDTHVNYAMRNNNGTDRAPSAVQVDIGDDKITSTVYTNMVWTVREDDDEDIGYVFYPYGDTENWLYDDDDEDGDGARVGINENNIWTLEASHIGDIILQNQATRRYLGVYNRQEWRCYTSLDDINYQRVRFYRLVADYRRDVTAGNWGTICLPKAGTIEGAQLYSIAGKVLDSTGAPVCIVLNEEDELEAGVPYIFQATSSLLSVTYTDDDAVEEADNLNGLYGSLQGQDVAQGMYILKNNEVRLCGTGNHIGANRAYIDMDNVPDYNGSGAGVKLFVEGGDADGMSLKGMDNVQSARIYNLAGQRLQRPMRGLNIINGKKVFVK